MKSQKIISAALIIFIGFFAIISERAFCSYLGRNIQPIGETTLVYNNFCLVWPSVIGAVMILIGLFLLISLLSIQK